METYQATLRLLRDLLANDQVRLILALIAADVILGIARALATRTFQFWRLADFMTTKVIPYIGGYLALRVVVAAMPEWEPLAIAAWAALITALTADIYANLKEIFPGLPSPPLLTKPPTIPQSKPETSMGSITRELITMAMPLFAAQVLAKRVTPRPSRPGKARAPQPETGYPGGNSAPPPPSGQTFTEGINGSV